MKQDPVGLRKLQDGLFDHDMKSSAVAVFHEFGQKFMEAIVVFLLVFVQVLTPPSRYVKLVRLYRDTETMSTRKKRNTEIFISTLKLAMTRFGLNQPQLAKKAAISSGLISDYLSGKSEPGFSNIEKIATGLDLTVAQFFALGEARKTQEVMAGRAYPGLDATLNPFVSYGLCSAPSCDFELDTTAPQDNVYCPNCGSQIIYKCPRCDRPIKFKPQNYCMKCGRPFKELPASPPSPPPAAPSSKESATRQRRRNAPVEPQMAPGSPGANLQANLVNFGAESEQEDLKD